MFKGGELTGGAYSIQELVGVDDMPDQGGTLRQALVSTIKQLRPRGGHPWWYEPGRAEIMQAVQVARLFRFDANATGFVAELAHNHVDLLADLAPTIRLPYPAVVLEWDNIVALSRTSPDSLRDAKNEPVPRVASLCWRCRPDSLDFNVLSYVTNLDHGKLLVWFCPMMVRFDPLTTKQEITVPSGETIALGVTMATEVCNQQVDRSILQTYHEKLAMHSFTMPSPPPELLVGSGGLAHFADPASPVTPELIWVLLRAYPWGRTFMHNTPHDGFYRLEPFVTVCKSPTLNLLEMVHQLHKVHREEGLEKVMSLIQGVGMSIMDDAGMSRMALSCLAMLNMRHSEVKLVEGKRRKATFVAGRLIPYMTEHNVTLTIPEPRFVRQVLPSLPTGIEHRRHDVIGHWCQSHRHGLANCPHDYDESDPNHKECKLCGHKMWWRKEHARGNAALGFVRHSAYQVEAKQPPRES